MWVHLAPGVVQFQVNDLTATGETGVSWSPPLQPNGVITSYQVVYSVYESSAIVRSEMLSNSTITYIIKNLGMLRNFATTSYHYVMGKYLRGNLHPLILVKLLRTCYQIHQKIPSHLIFNI